MANYETLKGLIDSVIRQNGRMEITGNRLNNVLNRMVTSLGAGYSFAGFAIPQTSPGTPDENIFYIATTRGTYSNFGGAVVQDTMLVFLWSGTWAVADSGVPVLEYVGDVVEEFNATIATINNSIATQGESIAALGGRMSAVEQKNTAQDASIATLQGTVSSIQSKNTEQDTAISGANSQISEIKTKDNQQDAAIATLQGAVSGIQTKDTQQDEAIETLGTRMEAVETTNVQQGGSLATLQGQVSDIQTKDSQQDEAIAGIEEVNTQQGKDIETLQGDVSDIKEKNTEQDTTLESLGTRMGAAEQGITTQGSEIDALSGRMSAVEQKNTAQDTAIQAAETASKAYTDEKIGELIGGAPETLDTLKEIADEIAAGGDTLDALVNQVGQKVDKTAYDTQVALLNQKDTELQEGLTAVEQKNTEQDTAISGIGGRVTTLENTTAALGTRVTAAEEKNTAQDTEISSLDERVTVLEQTSPSPEPGGDLSELEERVETVEQKNTAQDASIATLQGTVSNIQTKNTEQDTAISELAKRVAEVETANTTQGENITALQGDVSGIKQKNTEQDSSISAIEGRVTTVENTTTTQGGAIDALTTRMTSVEQKNTAQDTAIASAEAAAKAYTDEKIGDLINGAPETLDTLKEIADEIAAGGEAMDALVNQVGQKVDKTTYDAQITTLNQTDAALQESLSSVQQVNNQQGESITALGGRMTAVEQKNTEQDTAIQTAENNAKAYTDEKIGEIGGGGAGFGLVGKFYSSSNLPIVDDANLYKVITDSSFNRLSFSSDTIDDAVIGKPYFIHLERSSSGSSWEITVNDIDYSLSSSTTAALILVVFDENRELKIMIQEQ